MSRSAARTSSAEVRAPAFPEHGFDGGQAHAAGLPRRRGEGPEIEGPGPAEVRRGLEESGVVVPDLRLQLVGQAGSFFDQVAVRARQLAQPDDLRRRRLRLPERLPVGGERTGQDQGVPAVVLGSGRREPVAEAVELLGVEREHGIMFQMFCKMLSLKFGHGKSIGFAINHPLQERTTP